jgi:hypothetical protein
VVTLTNRHDPWWLSTPGDRHSEWSRASRDVYSRSQCGLLLQVSKHISTYDLRSVDRSDSLGFLDVIDAHADSLTGKSTRTQKKSFSIIVGAVGKWARHVQ